MTAKKQTGVDLHFKKMCEWVYLDLIWELHKCKNEILQELYTIKPFTDNHCTTHLSQQKV